MYRKLPLMNLSANPLYVDFQLHLGVYIALNGFVYMYKTYL